MNKDKLVLHDGTEITLESSNGIGALLVLVESRRAAAGLWEKFTKENLRLVQIKNESGEVTGNYTDMVLDHITGTEREEGKVGILFSLRSKTIEEELRERIASLEEGQQTQDAAIGDLGQAVSDIAEGGIV